MSGPVIIRLQHLPLEARSVDIRKFFDGLLIPDGGVHIIGGERGDAFIAFQCDEDARLAMARDGNLLCNAKIKLFLSSKNEMQSVITAARSHLQQLHTPATTTTATTTSTSSTSATASPLDKILQSQQTKPLDLLSSITKLLSKEAKPAEPAASISINEILSILKTSQSQKPSGEQHAAAKPSLLPTPSTMPAEPAAAKRKYEHKQQATAVAKAPLLPAPTPLPPRPLEPIVKVKNFASNCSYKDIRAFLQGVQIEHNGIKFMTEGPSGAHKGQAFVRLVSIVDLKKALCRHGQFYDDRQIEVVQCADSDMAAHSAALKKCEHAAKSAGVDAGFGYFIKIYGLPARFDQSALKNMFNNVRFVRIVTTNPTPIQSKIINQDGSHDTKTIMKAKKLCEVETQLDVERALTRQDERVGKSRVQIFQISKSEFERELSTVKNVADEQVEAEHLQTDHGVDNDDFNEDVDAAADDDDDDDDFFVLISGVPFSARVEDVRQFLKGISAKQISLLSEPDSMKPSGECICEFYTKSDRDAALAKHDTLFRNRLVKVKQLNSSEYKQLSWLKAAKGGKARAPLLGAKPALLATPASVTEKPKLNADYEETGNYKRAFNQAGYTSNKRVKPSSPIAMDLPPLPAELQKYKNSIVLLSNVSYEATREDILELFKHYSPIEQTLKIRHDDRGQPTGDAIVACVSHDQATKACRSLNGADFMGQSIRAVLISP